MYRLPILLIFIAVVAVLGRDARTARLTSPGAGEFVVSVEPGQPLASVAPRIAALGYHVDSEMADIHAIEVAGSSASLARLSALSGVRYAEPVGPVRATDMPSDPLFGDEYGYLSMENAPAAWNISKGSPGVIVAVVDTGVDVTHPNLRPNIWVNPHEIPNNGIDDDHNGCVDDVNGCSFVSDSSPGCHNVTNGYVNDDIGHGTFVAGIIGAAANGTGMVGVARNVRIMAVKVLDCYGAGDTVATARGIVYAARMGARVINLSLGGVMDSQVVRDAIDEATRDGALVVAAAGNDGADSVSFPARYAPVLAVGATSRSNPAARAPFSNWGPEIGVVAVGEDVVGTVPPSRCGIIFQCLPDGAHATGDGTSFSTPQVSGLAALMLSVNPSLTPGRIIDIIKNSATPLPPGSTPGWAGYGRIDMAAALRAVRDNHAPGDPCVVASVIDGERFTCTDGRTVRMLQIAAPTGTQCGADWAKAALGYLFLQPGRTVYLRYDVTRTDAQGEILAAPLWRGADGVDYNLSIVMAYVGLAKEADVGAGNMIFHNWALAAQSWGRATQRNMWGPNKPFTGGC